MLGTHAIMNQVKIMVMAFPMESMADKLAKPYSTLSNELAERDYAKLGFRTVLSMVGFALEPEAPEQSRVAAFKVLDMVDARFGRVGYTIPETDGSASDVLRLIAELSTEYAENVNQLAQAMEDGKWTPEEAAACRKENRDLLTACLRLEAFLGRLDGGNNA